MWTFNDKMLLSSDYIFLKIFSTVDHHYQFLSDASHQCLSRLKLTYSESMHVTEGKSQRDGNKEKRKERRGRHEKTRIANSLHPSSSLWSPQSLSPSHCHWAGMQVHSPNALTAHVKWFLPHEHSALH